MASVDQLQQRFNQVFNPQQAEVLAQVVTEAYSELVKTHDFNELKAIVRELAQAQNRTEQRMEELASAQRELASAQTRTEQRVEELAQAQNRTEQRVEELAQAQNRTEQRVEELAQAQNRTEQRMEELAQAQNRTEQRMEEMALAIRDTRRQLGGLSTTVGYTLENEAYKALPSLLAEDFGLSVQGRLKRGYVTDERGRSFEVNILGEANRGEQTVTIIGESKSQLSAPEIDRFIRRKLDPLRAVFPEVFPILVTHMVSSPEVEPYAKERGVALYYSYEF